MLHILWYIRIILCVYEKYNILALINVHKFCFCGIRICVFPIIYNLNICINKTNTSDAIVVCIICVYSSWSDLFILGPEKVEENLPDYPGFENDVYNVIKDYFWGLDEPLITHQLYEVFLSVMGEIQQHSLYTVFQHMKVYAYISQHFGGKSIKSHLECKTGI